MSAPNNYHEFPNPSTETLDTIEQTPDASNLMDVAEKWRPEGFLMDSVISTLSRAALRVVNRETGVAYSADELETKVLATAVVSTEDVLDRLKGSVGDPAKIGTEHLPDELEVDSLVIGEYEPGVQVREGTVARDGTRLLIYDANNTPVEVGGMGKENVIPYHRVSGTATVIPFGQPGSRTKQAGSKYWQEIARVKVPGLEMASGNLLQIVAELSVDSAAPIATLTNRALIVASEFWDRADQTVWFGATPSQPNFNQISPNYLPFVLSAANSQKSVSRLQRNHVIYYGSGQLGVNAAAIGTNQHGWDFTASAAFSGNLQAGFGGISRPDQKDMEFVIVVASSATATDYRVVNYQINISASPQ